MYPTEWDLPIVTTSPFLSAIGESGYTMCCETRVLASSTALELIAMATVI